MQRLTYDVIVIGGGIIGTATSRELLLRNPNLRLCIIEKEKTLVIGGGIIGTATSRELLLRNPNLRLCIIEKEKTLAAHQSGHNSGVLHTGVYYTPGSLKAKLCVEGLDLAYKYLDEKHITYRKCGKLIVAVNRAESMRLDSLFKRGIENGVKNIQLLDRKGIKDIEPHVEGLRAIWSPETGIVDWAEVNRSLGSDCLEKGAHVHYNWEVTSFSATKEHSHDTTTQTSQYPVVVRSKTRELQCKFVVTCGGLFSDKLAVMTGCSPEPKIIPFRGEYLLLKQEKCHLVKTNIYPVPYPNLPFLGVHITPRIDGSVWLGPNAVLALKREGYNLTDVSLNDVKDFLTYSGLIKLSFKHLGYGLREMYRGINYDAQVQVLKQYLPLLKTSDVTRGPSGVRAQAVDHQGNLVDDFVFDSGQGELKNRVLHVRNAPSPAATSSLAIAKVVVDRLQDQMRSLAPS